MSVRTAVQTKTAAKPATPQIVGGVLQRSAINSAAVQEVPSIVYDVLCSSGQPLDKATRAFVEPRFGHDFSNVRIHSDALAANSARSLNARAYTVGHDIVFGEEQYTPRTSTGQKLLAHELTHVIQQNGTPISHLQLAGGLASQTGELEADRVSEQIFQHKVRSQETIAISALPTGIYQQKNEGNSSQPNQRLDQQQALVLSKALDDESEQDAQKIRKILQDNIWLGSSNQADIMTIINKWAAKQLETGIRRTPFDYLIVALRRETYRIGWSEQLTSAFDQIFERMDKERVEEFKRYIQMRALAYKDEKPIEMVKFEVKTEDLVEGAELAAEVTAAFATGGGSVLLQIVAWLATTLPSLYQKVKTVVQFIDAIRNIKIDDISKFFNAKGLGNLLVQALFGEARSLPQFKAAKNDKESEMEPASGTEEKGLIRILHILIRIFNGLKGVYGKVVEYVNKGLAAINITTKPWFETFSMIYAGVIKTIQTVTRPDSALGEAITKIREVVSDFFKGIRSRVDESAGAIKSRVEMIGKPAQLLHILADKGVEMVLSFIITHPPSALVKLAFKMVATAAKKSIIELVREHIPFADTLIKKIAESDTIKGMLQPLQGPIAQVTGTIENVSGQAAALIGNVESRALGLLSSGVDLVKQLTGVSPQMSENATGATGTHPTGEPKSSEHEDATFAGQSSLSEFIEVVKQGFHTRLLAIGERNLITKGKQMSKAALEKGKEAVKGLATRVKGMLLGPKVEFKIAGEDHELWIEDRESEVVTLVASRKPTNNDDRLDAYKSALKDIKNPEEKDVVQKLISELRNLSDQAKNARNLKTKALETLKKKMTTIISEIEKKIPLSKRFKKSQQRMALQEDVNINPKTGEVCVVSKIGSPKERQEAEKELAAPGEVGLLGWHRAHLVGPGTGKEFSAGIMYAPRSYNLKYHAYLERLMRQLVNVFSNKKEEFGNVELWQRCTATPETINKFQLKQSHIQIYADTGDLLESWTFTITGSIKSPDVDVKEVESGGWYGFVEAMKEKNS